MDEKDNFWDNGNRSSFNPDLNQLPAIPPVSKGFPSPGDVWTWRVGRRVSATGFLILPERLKMKNAPKSFANKNTLSRYLETNFPVNALFASFSWDIPALFQPADPGLCHKAVCVYVVDAASLFDEDESAEDGEKESSTSRYSQRKRKQVQTQTYEPVEVKPNELTAGKRKRKKSLPRDAPQDNVIDLEEEEEEATKTNKRMKKRRGHAAEKEEDVSIPHIYVSPMNGVLAVSHSPVEINPEEFDTYLNTLENLLQQQDRSLLLLQGENMNGQKLG